MESKAPDIKELLRERLRESMIMNGFTNEQIDDFMAWLDKKVEEFNK